MSLTRIKAIILQELFITKGSIEVIMDLPFFSVVSVLVFGLVSVFLSGTINSTTAHYLLLGMLLWEIIRVVQYSMSVEALWNVWSRNLSNMFITPLSLKEYMFAQMLSGAIKAFVIFTLVSIMAVKLFGFNIFVLGWANIFLFFINLVIFSWSAGIVILGIIFRVGTRIQALAWGLIFLFQPLTAAFFPVGILPAPFQKIAYLLPPTYVFEAARAALKDTTVNWNLLGTAFLENIFYFILSLHFFNFMLHRSRQTGQFARNEE